MFRSLARIVVPVGMVSVFVLTSLANAQIVMPNPIKAPNPLTTTLSDFFVSNMQDKIMKCRRTRRPEVQVTATGRQRIACSFAEILNHVADISYILCSNAKGESRTLIRIPRIGFWGRPRSWFSPPQRGGFDYCDGVQLRVLVDAHLNRPGGLLWCRATNKMSDL